MTQDQQQWGRGGVIRGLDSARAQVTKWLQVELSCPRPREDAASPWCHPKMLLTGGRSYGRNNSSPSRCPYCLPGSGLSTQYLGAHLVLLTTYEVCTLVLPSLQVRRPRHRETT